MWIIKHRDHHEIERAQQNSNERGTLSDILGITKVPPHKSPTSEAADMELLSAQALNPYF